jgi:hypothetical protein
MMPFLTPYLKISTVPSLEGRKTLMQSALALLMPEIRDLESKLGFAVHPDEDGNCALQLTDGLVVVLTFSTVDDRYGFHCLLLCAPQIFSNGVFVQALRLNLWLSSEEAGVLAYADEGEGIVYTWSMRCRAQHDVPLLSDTLFSFVGYAQRMKALLTRARDDEYANTFGVVPE